MNDEEDSDNESKFSYPDVISYYLKEAKLSIFGNKFLLDLPGEDFSTYSEEDFYDFQKDGSYFKEEKFSD